MNPFLTHARNAVIALALSTSIALAHSPLDHSQPADGASLSAPPEQLVLTFHKPAMLTALSLSLNAQRTQPMPFDRGPAATTWQLPFTATESGEYTLEWRALSADGHPVRGQLQFTVTP